MPEPIFAREKANWLAEARAAACEPPAMAANAARRVRWRCINCHAEGELVGSNAGRWRELLEAHRMAGVCRSRGGLRIWFREGGGVDKSSLKK